MFVPPETEQGVVVGKRVAFAFDALRAMRNVAVSYRDCGPAPLTRPPGVLDDIGAFAREFATVEPDADGRPYATEMRDARVELAAAPGGERPPRSALLWLPVCCFLLLLTRSSPTSPASGSRKTARRTARTTWSSCWPTRSTGARGTRSRSTS